MLPNNVTLKVGLYLAIVLSAAMVAFTIGIARYHEEDLQREVSRHALQISEIIVESTRHAMLLNERDLAATIIQDIGSERRIEQVRVINKDGMVIHSNHVAEIGHTMNQQAEPCVLCHLTSKPLAQVPDDQRWRIHDTPEGGRVVRTMRAIRNEPSCSSASCHQHPETQSVLGVVDVAYSLDEVDQAAKRHRIIIAVMSLGFIVLVCVSVGLLLKRLIYIPLRDLEAGARKVSSGNLDHAIPVRSNDEFGRLTGSFNRMTQALRKSMMELQDLVQTLESKVEERTRALKTAEAEVAQGEKLAAVGLLASGVAHELNNPLTGVLTFTSLLRKKMQDGSEDAEDMDLVIRETRRCAGIIRRLLDFAREKVPSNGFFDLNRLIEDTVRFAAQPAIIQRIDMTLDLDPDLPQVWGDADLIKQVILNVVVNAEQAIEGRGRIIVETHRYGGGGAAARHGTPGTTELTGATGMMEPMVEITITDTGCGIPEANLQRIFDPFFTSKEVGKGTGLGLSVSHGIVKAHGGHIKVESTVGVGTIFRIRLPLSSAAKEPTPNAAEAIQ